MISMHRRALSFDHAPFGVPHPDYSWPLFLSPILTLVSLLAILHPRDSSIKLMRGEAQYSLGSSLQYRHALHGNSSLFPREISRATCVVKLDT